MRVTTARAARFTFIEFLRPISGPVPSPTSAASPASSSPKLPGSAAMSLCLILCTLALLGAPRSALGEQQLSPLAQEKLNELVAKLVEAKGKLWADRMETEILVASGLGSLSQMESRALRQAAAPITEKRLHEWSAKIRDIFQDIFTHREKDVTRKLEQMLRRTSELANEGISADFVRPYEDPAWIEVLQASLKPEIFGLWKDSFTANQKKLQAKAAATARHFIPFFRTDVEDPLWARFAEANLALSLAPPQLKRLEGLTKSIAERSVQLWLDHGERSYLLAEVPNYDDFDLGNWLPPSSNPSPEKQWQERLREVLSPAEIERLEQFRAARNDRRLSTLSRVYVSEMDQHLALTELQREKLLPIVFHLLEARPSLRSSQTIFANFQQSVYQPLDPESDLEFSKILEPEQRARWERVSKDLLTGLEDAEASILQEDEPEFPILLLEPDAEEAILSEMLCKLARRHGELYSARIALMAEDISRTACLSGNASAVLRSAAKGAASRAEDSWKTQLEIQIAIGLASSEERSLAVWFRQNGQYNFDPKDAGLPERLPLWLNAVNTVLSPTQKAAWEQALDARARFRSESMASALADEFDRFCPLSNPQWDLVRAAVVKLSDYWVDFETRYFSPLQVRRWHLQGIITAVLFAGLDPDLKSILSEQQWSRWKERPNALMFADFWRNFKTQHDERVGK